MAATQASKAGELCCAVGLISKVPGHVYGRLSSSEDNRSRMRIAIRAIPALELEVRHGIRRAWRYHCWRCREEVRPPLELWRKDLIDMDDALIH